MSDTLTKHIDLIRKHVCADYKDMYREPTRGIPHPFMTPGSRQYANCLWDWDSWLSNIALRQIIREAGTDEDLEEARKYERGCVLNFLDWGGKDGWIPICAYENGPSKPEAIYARNMHKPCLAQHAAFLVREDGGDAEWLRERLYPLQTFLNNYRNHHRHACGLYFWQNDSAIGVDNDPCTFGRPPRSSGSIYLNTMMLMELRAMVYLCNCLNLDAIGRHFADDAEALEAAIREYCWDEWLGFYFSVDLNLTPVETHDTFGRHDGQPRDWPCLIQRIGVWSGFMAMWAGIVTPREAERMVNEHYYNEDTFGCAGGVRTLSKLEKMYNLRASGNPSSWLGPVWGISNYLTFRGFVRCRQDTAAKDLAEKTIRLFGRDLERFGSLHEYYQPDNGEPILNRGFQNWNYLVLNMIAWLEGRDAVTEFVDNQ